MFRIIRSRALRGLRESAAESDKAAVESDLAAQTYSDEAEKWYEKYADESARADRAEACAESLSTELEQQVAGLTAVVRQTSRERDDARAEAEASREQVLLDAEDRVALRMLLRTVRRQAARADRVYVLYRKGELHSVHLSQESAEESAEAEGAPRSGWTKGTPGAAMPPAVEVAWQVQALPLGGCR